MPPSPEKVVPVAPGKIEQIREAGRRQLSPEEFEELETLLGELEVYGVTPYINVELGKLVGKIEWELEISESPEWAEALIACDAAFLGAELKEMCDEVGISSYGHKKELCRRLYYAKQPAVVEVMEPYLHGERRLQ
jgi:hypothetical protein